MLSVPLQCFNSNRFRAVRFFFSSIYQILCCPVARGWWAVNYFGICMRHVQTVHIRRVSPSPSTNVSCAWRFFDFFLGRKIHILLSAFCMTNQPANAFWRAQICCVLWAMTINLLQYFPLPGMFWYDLRYISYLGIQKVSFDRLCQWELSKVKEARVLESGLPD